MHARAYFCVQKYKMAITWLCNDNRLVKYLNCKLPDQWKRYIVHMNTTCYSEISSSAKFDKTSCYDRRRARVEGGTIDMVCITLSNT